MTIFNLHIRGRLYAGFGLLVLFGIVLAGFGVWNLYGIEDQVGAMKVQSQNAIRIGEITTELQGARRAILRYAFDQDEPSFAKSGKRLARVAELLQQAAKTTISEQNRAIYGETANQVAELKTKRDALGEAVKSMLAGRTQLFGDGDKMAADVQKFVEAAQDTPFAKAADALIQSSPGSRRQLAHAGDPRCQGAGYVQDQCRQSSATNCGP